MATTVFCTYLTQQKILPCPAQKFIFFAVLLSSLVTYQLRKSYGSENPIKTEIIPLENINEEIIISNNQALDQLGIDQIVDDDDNDCLLIDAKDDPCCTKEKVSNCCRLFTTFMISRVGLLILMIGYVTLGGIIFQELEAENERISIQRGEEKIEKIVEKIYDHIVYSSVDLNDQKFGDFLTHEIENFRDFVTNSTVNGTLISSDQYQWDYVGGVFYAVTLVTTIGYGHITCKTRNGKIFTILYSSIGIPLMALFLANVGSSTAGVFKFIYLKSISCRRSYRVRRHHSRRLLQNSVTEREERESQIESSLTDPKLERRLKQNRQKQLLMNELHQRRQSSTSAMSSASNIRQDTENFNNALSDTNIYDANTYAQYVQLQQPLNNGDSQMDFKLIDKNFSLLDSAPEQQKTELKNDILANKSDPKLNDAIKRINDLIENENGLDDTELSKSTVDGVAIAVSDINDKKYLKTVNFKNMGSDERRVNDDGSIEQIINLTENPLSTDDNKTPKKRNFFKTFSYRIRRSTKKKPDNTTVATVKKTLRRTSSEPKFTHALTPTSVQLVPQQEEPPAQDEPKQSQSTSFRNKLKHFNPKSKSFSLRLKKSGNNKKDQNPQRRHSADSNIIQEIKPVSDSGGAASTSTQSSSHKSIVYNKKTSPHISQQFIFPATSPSIRRSPINFDSQRSLKQNLSRSELKLYYSEMHKRRKKKTSVPLFLILIIMPVYLVCGMFIFSSFENWSKLDAFYFCFVTVATIGFGDFIPGISISAHSSQMIMSISALYILTGLVLLAMCFNLINNQLKNKIKSFARKIGLTQC